MFEFDIFIKEPKRKRGKCPCGGYFQDWHSHASDCKELGGDVDYSKKFVTIVPCKECHEHPCTCRKE